MDYSFFYIRSYLSIATMNKKTNKFSFRQRIRSLRFAINGLKIVFKEEHNFRVHLAVSLLIIALGICFNISTYEWLIIFILTGMVFAFEIINSAIENICDYVSPSWHKVIKRTKDLSAAAVLTTVIIAVICGFIIFAPKIWKYIFSQINLN